MSDGSEWLGSINTEMLFQDYIEVSAQIGEPRRQKKSQFGERLKKQGATKRRPSERGEEGGSSRPYHYCFPSLEKARSNFEGLVGQTIDWPAMPAVGGADDEVP